MHRNNRRSWKNKCPFNKSQKSKDVHSIKVRIRILHCDPFIPSPVLEVLSRPRWGPVPVITLWIRWDLSEPGRIHCQLWTLTDRILWIWALHQRANHSGIRMRSLTQVVSECTHSHTSRHQCYHQTDCCHGTKYLLNVHAPNWAMIPSAAIGEYTSSIGEYTLLMCSCSSSSTLEKAVSPRRKV